MTTSEHDHLGTLFREALINIASRGCEAGHYSSSEKASYASTELRRRWSKGALPTANAAILRLGWRDGLGRWGVLTLVTITAMCLAVDSYALSGAIEGAIRFWTGL
jgi:hypothetical protein